MKQIDTLSKRNRSLEEKLNQLTNNRETTSGDKEHAHQKGNGLLVLGDSIIRNVGVDHPDMKIVCFPGIGAEQLQRVIEKRDFGAPDTLIHVGTNDMKSSRNLDYVMGDIYDLTNTMKTKFSTSRVILSGIMRRRDISWRRIGALNGRI